MLTQVAKRTKLIKDSDTFKQIVEDFDTTKVGSKAFRSQKNVAVFSMLEDIATMIRSQKTFALQESYDLSCVRYLGCVVNSFEAWDGKPRTLNSLLKPCLHDGNMCVELQEGKGKGQLQNIVKIIKTFNELGKEILRLDGRSSRAERRRNRCCLALSCNMIMCFIFIIIGVTVIYANSLLSDEGVGTELAITAANEELTTRDKQTKESFLQRNVSVTRNKGFTFLRDDNKFLTVKGEETNVEKPNPEGKYTIESFGDLIISTLAQATVLDAHTHLIVHSLHNKKECHKAFFGEMPDSIVTNLKTLLENTISAKLNKGLQEYKKTMQTKDVPTQLIPDEDFQYSFPEGEEKRALDVLQEDRLNDHVSYLRLNNVKKAIQEFPVRDLSNLTDFLNQWYGFKNSLNIKNESSKIYMFQLSSLLDADMKATCDLLNSRNSKAELKEWAEANKKFGKSFAMTKYYLWYHLRHFREELIRSRADVARGETRRSHDIERQSSSSPPSSSPKQNLSSLLFLFVLGAEVVVGVSVLVVSRTMRLSHGHPHSVEEASHWKATMLLNMIGVFSLLDSVAASFLLSYFASSFFPSFFDPRPKLVTFLRLTSLLLGPASPFLVGAASSLLLAVSQFETEVECELGDEVRSSLLSANLTDDAAWSSLVSSTHPLLSVEEPLLDGAGLASLYALVLLLLALKAVSAWANWIPSLLRLPTQLHSS